MWKTHRDSLRWRLIATTVVSSIVVGLACTAIVLFIAWKETGKAFDDTLKEGARIVQALGSNALRAPSATPEDGASAGQTLRLNYQLLAHDGRVLLHGKEAPRTAFLAPASIRHKKFHDASVDGHWWRIYALRDPAQDFSVLVGQKWEDRNELIEEVLESLAWPLISLWLALGAWNAWMIRRQLAPLERLASAIAEKSLHDLSPLTSSQGPREVASVAQAMNTLLQRLSRALEGERRFTADAAHELRTPLAALASRIQLLQRSHAQPAGSPAQEQASATLAADLQRLREDIARSTLLVENLLQLARLDPESTESLPMQALAVRGLLEEVCAACQPAARAHHMELLVDCTAGLAMGQHDWLFSALRNLVDNAIHYGHPGGKVVLSASMRSGRVRLAVSDDGPGIPAHEISQVSKRFYRILGHASPGSGLGLSIVERVAQLHGGALQLGQGLGGQGLGAAFSVPAGPSDSLQPGSLQ
jgi:two-component system sensor histidine kinase QseC